MEMTLEKAILEIEKAASVAVTEVRFCEKHIVGKVSNRQGDIYLHMVTKDHPRGKRIKNRQLAIGTTQGSRHIIEGDDVEVYEGTTLPNYVKDRRTPLGPCFVIKRRETNTHPEHAHSSLPAGTYQVTHQMDARTWRRTLD